MQCGHDDESKQVNTESGASGQPAQKRLSVFAKLFKHRREILLGRDKDVNGFAPRIVNFFMALKMRNIRKKSKNREIGDLFGT
jgi:hypothetical protein